LDAKPPPLLAPEDERGRGGEVAHDGEDECRGDDGGESAVVGCSSGGSGSSVGGLYRTDGEGGEAGSSSNAGLGIGRGESGVAPRMVGSLVAPSRARVSVRREPSIARLVGMASAASSSVLPISLSSSVESESESTMEL